jgi:hypothetical protein
MVESQTLRTGLQTPSGKTTVIPTFCWSRFATCSVTFFLLEQVCNLLRNVLWSNLKRYGRGCKPRPAKKVLKLWLSGLQSKAYQLLEIRNIGIRS